jgi:2'-5' RNA ligase
VERPNWFIGLRVRGGDFLRALSPPVHVRLFSADDLHITLAFLGRVDEARAQAAFAFADQVRLPALATQQGGVRALGGRRRPSAFSALPTEHREAIEASMGAVRDLMCDAAAARRETRPPLAHITFARPERRASDDEVHAATQWATRLDLGRPQVRIDSVGLYTWSPDRSQRLFALRAKRPLAAPSS